MLVDGGHLRNSNGAIHSASLMERSGSTVMRCYMSLTYQEWGESVRTFFFFSGGALLIMFDPLGIIKGSVGEMWKLSSPAQTFILQEPVFISVNGKYSGEVFSYFTYMSTIMSLFISIN